MFRQGIFAIIAVCTLSIWAVDLPGRCPDEPYPVVQNYSLERYFGDWYLSELYVDWYQEGLGCGTVTYSENPNGTIGIIFEYRLKDNKSEYNFDDMHAYLSYPSEFPTGQWNVSKYGRPADRVSYNILATDYETYSVVWDCVNKGKAKDEKYFLFTRDRVLDPRPVEVDIIIDKYIDREYITKLDQNPSCYEGELKRSSGS